MKHDMGENGMKKNGFSVIGKSLPRIDGPAKCAGDTRYADDIVMPRMLFCRLLRSPHPHALVHGVSAQRALELPGVHAVITGEDVPKKFGIMPSTQDEEALAVDKVRYVGDPVAAVAAVSEDVAEEALRLIDVEYEVLDPILSIEGALQPRTIASTPGTAAPTSRRPSPSSSARWTPASRKPTRSSRARTSSRATPTCPWSSTALWQPTPRTASSPCGPPPRRRTTCTARLPGCWTCPWGTSGSSPRRWAAVSAARAIPSPTRSRWPSWR